jgi:hypothetical protein
MWTTVASLCFTTTLLCRYIPYQLLLFKKCNPPVGIPDPISKRDERCYGIGLYGDMRHKTPGMLPAVVSFLAKIYDS